MSSLRILAPENLAEDWDNVGLLLGSGDRIVEKLLLCLDVTPQVAKEALRLDADMIVSHHPIIFNTIKSINNETPEGKMLYSLIRNETSVFCSHTNLDICENGLNRYLAEKLELLDIHNSVNSSDENKYVKIGRLSAAKDIDKFTVIVKENLGVKNLRIIGDVQDQITNVAVFCGGYDARLCEGIKGEAEILVTGDIKYHDAQEIANNGFCAIDAGHFGTEVIVKELLFTYLKSKFPNIDIISSASENDPFRFY
jgi:dinuclear metal center YbgI/SA1388 family protein